MYFIEQLRSMTSSYILLLRDEHTAAAGARRAQISTDENALFDTENREKPFFFFMNEEGFDDLYLCLYDREIPYGQ